MHFIDEAQIYVLGGLGGNGCVAFRREKHVPRGGPSGGDGGHGGSVVVVGGSNLNTLYHLRHRPRFVAERGRHGEGSTRTGRSGGDCEIAVPIGTLIRDEESGDLLIEILQDGECCVVAKGGRGGRGNARFKSATRQVPDRAERGGEGEEHHLHLELKLLADVGLLGLPNAGKSTLVSKISAARPKIAEYPFTTLVPNLGVVAVDAFSEPFVVADIPGLIAGAAAGAGLGIQFLKHIERCRVLAHLVDLSGDLSGESGSVEADLRSVEEELGAFDSDLLTRPRLIVGSKLDAAVPERREALRKSAARRELPYFEISAISGRGLKLFLRELQTRLETGSE